MPITIGKAVENDYNNPLGLLSDCHRRIERFLNLLLTVVEQTAGGKLSAEARQALETALRYFREAAPKHLCDEEESLFPRLRALQTPAAQAALSMLETLHEEHETATPAHQEVESLCRQWLAEGPLPEPSEQRLRQVLESLKSLYERHIAVEERELFPLAQALLTEPDLQSMAAEMAARRGIDLQARAALLNPS